jgi:hypothetical protein
MLFSQSTIFDGHFRQANNIFTVHYGDPQFMLKMPTPSEAPAPHHGSMDGDFRHTTWNSISMPFLMFLPRYNPFEGPLFGHLNYTKKSLPMTSEGGWLLNASLVDEWKELESALRAVMEVMHAELGDHAFAGMVPFAYPSRFGYTAGPQRSRQAMVSVAMRSRDAFLPLMVCITLMFVLLERVANEWWRARVVKALDCHPQWFCDLELSAVGDLRTEHVGAIINMTYSDLPGRR